MPMPSAEEFYRALMGTPAAAPQPKPEIYSPVSKSWPTPEDVAFAKANDATYGYDAAPRLQAGTIEQMPITAVPDWANSTSIKILGGKPLKGPKTDPGVVPPDVNDNLYAAWLAAQKSPTAALGYDLQHTVSSPTSKGSPSLTIGGLYDTASDKMWFDNRLDSPLAHESMHRGINMLNGTEKGHSAVKNFPSAEEYIVRALMQKNFGDIETKDLLKEGITSGTGTNQINKGKMLNNNYSEGLNAIEDAAAVLYHKRGRPMGPR